jgi:outer membrane cobalamin receptor
LQGGYEYRNEKLSRGSLAPSTGPGGDNPFGIAEKGRDINVLWGQQELNVTSRLKLTAGLRYDDYSDFGHEWSPKAEAVLTLAPEHRLRGSYGHGFRPPHFGELYLNTPPFFVGNPDLVPEISGRPRSASASRAWARTGSTSTRRSTTSSTRATSSSPTPTARRSRDSSRCGSPPGPSRPG